MKRNSCKIYAVLLGLALLWRMLGAPISMEEIRNLQTPLWQARILLPQRVSRVLERWISTAAAQDEQTMAADDANEPLLVYLTQENRLVQMTMEGYVCGVLAAEMPAQYHLEALKAQAVAARTRVMWQREQGGCALHPGADICTDSAHCQGYATLAQCRKQWGDNYEAYRDRLLMAERETAGEWLAYEDKPITVLYHASSGGKTENVQTVFAESLPYLVSVESMEEESVYETTLTFEEMTEKINAALTGFALAPNEVQRTLAIGGFTESGRVSHLLLGGRQVEATDFRAALGLRSTWFSISMDEQGVTFHQRGYGHGVGMSQAGANSMAADGQSYQQILQHYYTGVHIRKP